MRASKGAGFVVACTMLGACAQIVPEQELAGLEPTATVLVPDTVFQAPEAIGLPVKTAGKPRLSALRAIEPEAVEPTPPMATFLRYHGRGPSDAVVPGSIATSQELAKPAPPVRYTKPKARPGVKAKAETSPATRRAVRSTPSPAPRPIAFAPRPTRRPITEIAAAKNQPRTVAPVLPSRPSIKALGSRSLGTPFASSTDSSPTGLPTLYSPEVAIPLGTVPASLGLANLQAAEAALPVADSLEQSGADESGTLGWEAASALVRAGEVEAAIDIGEFEVLMTLCSGRGVITIQPTPGALEAIKAPEVICGKTASLTSQ